jgi:LysM domain
VGMRLPPTPPPGEKIPNQLSNGLPPDIEWWTHYYDPQVPHQRDQSGRIIYDVEEVTAYFARNPIPTDTRWWTQMYVPRFAGVNMYADAWQGPGDSTRKTLDSASYTQLSVRNRGGGLDYSTRLLFSPEWNTLWRSPVYGPAMLKALDGLNTKREQAGLPTMSPPTLGEPPGVDRQWVAAAFGGRQPGTTRVAGNPQGQRLASTNVPQPSPTTQFKPGSGADTPLSVPRSAGQPPHGNGTQGKLPSPPPLTRDETASGSTLEPAPDEPGAPTRSASHTYVVRRGDTLFGIARRMGVELPDLLRANPSITDARRLLVGQHISVPRVGQSSAR